MSRLQNRCRSNHMPIWAALFYCLTVIFISSLAIARDTDLSQFDGCWSGMHEDMELGPMAVGLTIKESGSSGGMEYLLHYGAPRHCRLVAEYAGTEDNVYYFRFTDSNGGGCDELYKDEMSLQLDGQGNLNVTLQGKQKKENYELKKDKGSSADCLIR